MAGRGLFRPDLYYRINVIQLVLPPLRDRGKDILEIAEILLSKRATNHNKPAMHFSPKAVQAITTYHWPGNVRELENVIERSVILTEENEISAELLNIDLELINVSAAHTLPNKDDLLSFNAAPQTSPFSIPRAASRSSDNLSLDDYFQRFVLEHQNTMNETELAKKLGVSRKCLWERRQRLGIPRKKPNKQG